MNINSRNKINSGKLYIVPTPIGNFLDITKRALLILKEVNIIACENIKNTYLLLKHFKIYTTLTSIHQHNEIKKSQKLIQKLIKGKNIALVADAGTPLINDPGYILVNLCHENQITIIPLPGACAAITALIASGLPSNKFCYEGFLPSKKNARCKTLKNLKYEQRTIIFYETSRRLLHSLEDIIKEFGPDRNIAIAKELTKIWEFIYKAPAKKILTWLLSDKNKCKGEIVIIIKGYICSNQHLLSNKILKTLKLLKEVLPLKIAVKVTTKIHNIKKNQLYRYAINLKDDILS